MSNDDIIERLDLTARLLELHNQDSVRIKALQSAVFNLEKVTEPLAEMPIEALLKQPGIGKRIAQTIREIAETGSMTELETLLAETPTGVLDLFGVKGLGVKKVRALWRDAGIDSLDSLQQAAETGRIAAMKGFGVSTQEKILTELAFMFRQKGKLRMNQADALALQLTDVLSQYFGRVAVSGQVRLREQEVDTVQLLLETQNPVAAMQTLQQLEGLTRNEQTSTPFIWRGQREGVDVQVELVFANPNTFDRVLFLRSVSPEHLGVSGTSGVAVGQAAYTLPWVSEEAVYESVGLPFVPVEMRDNPNAFHWAAQHRPDELIRWENLNGTLHNHSTWSDGKASIEQMAERCRALGLTYLGMADHSQTATYASGLNPERVRAQQAEIDNLNRGFGKDFRIFKGIESDILSDGSLDYDTETLASFDFVVASVHQTLTMSLEKATTRLLRAIENPYTTILGHPTGRLLLAREGYPIDHRAIINACAEHEVVIEINASPYRLDLDWRWIDYAMQQGVWLSINPDAHSTEGLLDMHYGVAVGRKGGLTASRTFNALTLPQITDYFANRRARISR